MKSSDEVPETALLLMKMALGLIDAAGGRNGPVARHLNAAIEIGLGNRTMAPQLTPPCSQAASEYNPRDG